jgi:hypothetical protein
MEVSEDAGRKVDSVRVSGSTITRSYLLNRTEDEGMSTAREVATELVMRTKRFKDGRRRVGVGEAGKAGGVLMSP